MASNNKIISKRFIGKFLNEAVVNKFEALSQIGPRGQRGKKKTKSVKLVSVSGKFRNGHFPVSTGVASGI
jgi:transposase